MADIIEKLRELRQSSESSVVTGIEVAANPDRPTIQHPLESWLVDLILDQLTDPEGHSLSLVVLSGNAGDGKSFLLREIRSQLEAEADLSPSQVSWLLDATESDRQDQQAVDRLRDFFRDFADGEEWGSTSLHVAAMNTGTVVGFISADQEDPRFKKLSDVLGLQLAIRSTPTTDEESRAFWEDFDRVLVVDLDRRPLFPIKQDRESFLDQMLDTLDRSHPGSFLATADTACGSCPYAAGCPVNANLTALASDRVRARLNTLFLDVTLEDRIHLGPRALWHVVYQMTVGGLDAQSFEEHSPLLSCQDIGGLTPDRRASALFFSSLFDVATGGAETGGSALSGELERVDPATRFTLAVHEQALAASLSVEEDRQIADSYETALGVQNGVFAGPPGDPSGRARNAARRAFFLSPSDPDPIRHDWLQAWADSLEEHRNDIVSGTPTRHPSSHVLISVLSDLYRSPQRDRLWRLDLPWRSLKQLHGQVDLRPGPKQVHDNRRMEAPDSFREGGMRAVSRELSEHLGTYPLSISVSLRDGPDVRLTWPLFRLLKRVDEGGYVAGSLDPERVQNLRRIGASLGAQASVTDGVAVIMDGDALLCDDDDEGGYDVVPL